MLIAAGTGMAQMHSLIEYCRAAGFPHPVHLYWGCGGRRISTDCPIGKSGRA